MSCNPLTIDVEETVGVALRSRAAREGVSPSEVVNAILRKALAAEIDEAAGLPPLAAVIQEHHDRRQLEALRGQGSSARTRQRPT